MKKPTMLALGVILVAAFATASADSPNTGRLINQTAAYAGGDTSYRGNYNTSVVNNISNALFGSQDSGYSNSVNLGGGTSGQGSQYPNTGYTAAADAGVQDCDDLRGRLNARYQERAEAMLPKSKVSDATKSRGLSSILALANSADPIAAITGMLVRTAVIQMMERADTYLNNKVEDIRNDISKGLSSDVRKGLGYANDAYNSYNTANRQR